MLCVSCWEGTGSDPCSRCGAPAMLVGRYRLEALIAEGRRGSTWRAVREDGTVVAIKERPLRRAGSRDARVLLRREAEVLRQLHHPGIPAFEESFFTGRGRGRTLWLVEEHVDGVTLAQELAWHRMSEDDVVGVLDELLEILGYLHGLSPPVVHRDVKPGNVMRTRDGRLVLIDFGAVRSEILDPELGGTTVAGTFGYMAPEQFRGDASPATDVYGVGALAVALLTRKEPHTLLDWTGRLRWRRHAQVSDDLARLVDAFLEPDPARRPSRPRQRLRDLRALARPVPGTPRRRVSSTVLDVTRHLAAGAAFLVLGFGMVATGSLVAGLQIPQRALSEVLPLALAHEPPPVQVDPVLQGCFLRFGPTAPLPAAEGHDPGAPTALRQCVAGTLTRSR